MERGQLSWRAAIAEETWTVPAPRPEHLVKFRADWGGRCRVVVVRFLMAVYMSFWLSLSIIGGAGDPPFTDVIMGPLNFGWKWVIFLTNWSLSILVLYLWCAWLASLFFYRNEAYGKFVWILRNVTSIAAVTVSSLYWTILFPMSGQTDVLDFHCHGGNSIIMLVDLALSPLPFYLKHGYQGTTYLLIYLLFSIIYWDAGATDPNGNHYIYPPLNYHHPWVASMLVLGTTLVVVPLLNLALWLWVRMWERGAKRQEGRLLLDHQDSLTVNLREEGDLEKPIV